MAVKKQVQSLPTARGGRTTPRARLESLGKVTIALQMRSPSSFRGASLASRVASSVVSAPLLPVLRLHAHVITPSLVDAVAVAVECGP
jgi:hypothetical protein